MKCSIEGCKGKAKLDIQIGTAWGHYCERDAIDVMLIVSVGLYRVHEDGDSDKVE